MKHEHMMGFLKPALDELGITLDDVFEVRLMVTYWEVDFYYRKGDGNIAWDKVREDAHWGTLKINYS